MNEDGSNMNETDGWNQYVKVYGIPDFESAFAELDTNLWGWIGCCRAGITPYEWLPTDRMIGKYLQDCVDKRRRIDADSFVDFMYYDGKFYMFSRGGTDVADRTRDGFYRKMSQTHRMDY